MTQLSAGHSKTTLVVVEFLVYQKQVFKTNASASRKSRTMMVTIQSIILTKAKLIITFKTRLWTATQGQLSN